MSQWTHVNASIRFDGIQGSPMLPEESDFKIDLPMGSEGPLNYNIEINPDKSCMASISAVFYGDLRDFDSEDAEGILPYFTKLCEGRFVRSGLIEIDIEYGDRLFYWYNTENSKWESLIKGN